jgi:hypothetical protein
MGSKDRIIEPEDDRRWKSGEIKDQWKRQSFSHCQTLPKSDGRETLDFN